MYSLVYIEPIKPQTRDLHRLHKATGACLNSGGCPALGSLSQGSQKPRQISRHDEPLCSRWESARKQSKKEKEDTGEARFPRNWSVSLFSRSAFILFVIHRDKWKIQSHAGSAALTLIKTRLPLCILSYIHRSQVIYIIFQPGGLLAFYGPFLIRIRQPENLFALKVLFLLKSGATLRKH